MTTESNDIDDTFLYFAYGSNLLASRLHINNPSAVRYAVGKLNSYRLDFVLNSNRWRGSIANIKPFDGESVWGAIWRLDAKDLPSLDRQEGADRNFYSRKEIQVQVANEGKVKCYVYILEKLASEKNYDLSELPPNRQPSKIYLQTIIDGAKESNLPPEYIERLEKVAHNGYSGNVDLALHN